MEISKTFVTIGANTAPLAAGLNQAKGMVKTSTVAMNAQLKTIGTTMILVGAAVAVGFGMAIKTAAKFEQSMANTASVAGATGEELKKLSNYAREMGKQSVFSASQAADAMYYLGSAGMNTEEIMGALKGTLLLAAATASDLAYTSESVAATLSQFGFAAEEAGRVANVFAAAISGSQATMEKLTTSMSYVGPMAKSMGISIETTTGILMNLYNAGLDGSKAGTSLRMAFVKLIDPTEKGANALDRLKVSIKDSSGEMRPFEDIIDDLGEAGMTTADAMDIFGIRAGPSMIALVGQGIGSIQKMTDTVTGTNKAAEMAAIQINTFQGAIKLLKSAFEELQIVIANHIMPTLTKMVKGITKVINVISGWMEKNKLLSGIIVKFTALLGILVGAGGAIILGVLAFQKIKIAILATKGAFLALKAVMITFGTAASGPIGIIIGAVIALYLAWTTNFIGIRDFTIAIVEKVKEALGWLWDKVKWVLEKLGLLKETIETGGGGGAGAFADEIDEVGTSADGAATDVDTLVDSVEGLGDELKETETKLDEFGNKIETFDEWVARLAKESAEANEEMANAAESAYQKYSDAMQPIEDRLYELSHTEEEVAARKLQLEREKAEATIKGAELGTEAEAEALRKVKEVYEAEINIIIAKIEEKKQEEIEAAKTTEETATVQGRAIYGIGEKWDELIGKVNAYATAVENAAQEEFLASVPTIDESGYTPDYIPEPKPTTEGFAKGTPFVEKTGIYKVHKGEAVLPERINPFKNLSFTNPIQKSTWQRNETSNTYSPIINITIQGDGDKWQIKSAIKEALDESALQFGRSGSFVMSGMA